MQYLGFVLLQATAANPVTTFLPLIFIVAIFYFLVFMRMQRQKKQQAQMLSSLQSGGEVVTTGCIAGAIVSLSDDPLIIRVKPDNSKLQIPRLTLSELLATNEEKRQ